MATVDSEFRRPSSLDVAIELEQQISVQSQIEGAVRQRLLDSGYHALRKVECYYDAGVLTLRGRVPSFHQKQVAEGLVGGDLVRVVVNQLEVVARPQWDLVPPGIWRKERLRRGKR
ncbi:MAG TPA: BON domain-containing protein [Pirellulales bacterium]|nr:BON domain-containing protein [Pirellulales bacterium]